MKKITSILLTSVLALSIFVSQANAQSINTVITGTVRGPENTTISGASVTVVCDGNVRNTSTNSSGDYIVTYPSSECVQGDTATATATNGDGSGSNSGTVQRFTAVNGLELDIAILDIAIAVPEFGIVTGVISALGSGVVYLGMKRKFV